MLERFALTSGAPHLRGESVYLRAAHAGDWTDWAQLRAESRDFLTPWEPAWPDDALTKAAFRRRLRRLAREARDESGFAYLIFWHGDNAMVGGLTVSNLRRGVTQSASIGYWMGRRYAGRGLMRDAVRTTIGWAFNEMRLHRLEAACLPDNEPSKRVLLRCGFRQEGLARDYLCIDNAWRDHVLFALLSSDKRPW